MKRLVTLSYWLTKQIDVFLQPLALLGIRLYIGLIFFNSGLLKLKDWDSTLFLFEYEYTVPLLPYDLAAYFAAAGELILPWLLFLGLFSRVGALGLIMMTLVIELFVYPGTTEHYLWLCILLGIFSTGAGKLSADFALRKWLFKSE